MKTRKITEGKVSLLIPTDRKYDASVFYNDEATLTRDISVSALQVFQNLSKNKLTVCDALSATGSRGLRYAAEVKGISKVTLNDYNPMAVKLIKKNITLNKLGKKCTASKSDANVLLSKNIYGFIDLDPFGPPVQFLDSTARSIYHKGFVGVTATDTIALCGTFPDACFRKYGIRSIKVPVYNELGLRILISSIILSFARHERAFVPVLSFSYHHYYRVFGRIEHGKVETLLKEFDTIEYNGKKCGPIYLGKINDRTFVESVINELRERDFKNKKEELKLLSMIKEEADLPPLYYDLHELSKKYKFKIPNYDEFISRLREKGFKASKTLFSDKGIKTDATLEELLKILYFGYEISK